MKAQKFLTLVCILSAASLWAHVPQGLNYQAVAHNVSGGIIQNEGISVLFTIHEGSETGDVIYQEHQTTTTNQFGLFTVVIGKGVVERGSFDKIKWANGEKFLQVETGEL